MKKQFSGRAALFAAAVAASLFVLGCGKTEKTAAAEKQDQTVRVGVVTTSLATFSETGVYYGKLAGTQSATLISFLGGRVDSIDGAEGAPVSAGQSLGKINATKAGSNRDLAALNEKIAKENLDRQRQFLKDGNAPQISVDQSELAWLSAKNSLIDAQKALDGALCVSPINGIVTRRFIEQYQELAPGSPTFSVSNIDRMKVTIGIPEPEMAGIDVGNTAEVTVASFPGTVWPGSITRLSREVSAQTLSFQAEISIENPGRKLLPGASAAVNLRRRTLERQIVVPTEAVLSGDKESFVMVERDGVARKVPVSTGPSSRTQTVILKGLKAGENVILQGNNLVVDGTAVQVTVRNPL